MVYGRLSRLISDGAGYTGVDQGCSDRIVEYLHITVTYNQVPANQSASVLRAGRITQWASTTFCIPTED